MMHISSIRAGGQGNLRHYHCTIFQDHICSDTHEGVFPEAIPGQLHQGCLCGPGPDRQAKTARGTPFKQNTVADFIRLMKRFFLWMAENGKSEIPERIAGHQATQLC